MVLEKLEEKAKLDNRITRHTINLTHKNENFYNLKVEFYKDDSVRLVRYKNDRIIPGKIVSKRMNCFNSNSNKEKIDSDKKKSDNSYIFSIRRKIQQYARNNDFNYFVTLTFDPKKIEENDCDEYRFQILKKWLHRERRKANYKNKEFKYIFVPEYHKSGKIHFHGLIGGNYNLDLIKSEKSKRETYNLTTWIFGFSMINKIRSKRRTSSYISKYISKELLNSPVSKNKKHYWCSKNLKLPKVKLIKKNIDLSQYESSFDSEVCEIYELDKKQIEKIIK